MYKLAVTYIKQIAIAFFCEWVENLPALNKQLLTGIYNPTQD
ncbi:hypothetical protein [Anabaena azotica]|nr:hypothetical protein [Anabaena azotica]